MNSGAEQNSFSSMFNLWIFVLAVFFLVFAGMAPRREVPAGVAGLHPFYNFPATTARDVLTRWNNRLGWLYNREIAVAPTVNWTRLREVGLVDRVGPFLTKIFIGDGYSFTCSGWQNLFRVQERVYKEFCVEFFATVTFQETVQDPHWPQALVF